MFLRRMGWILLVVFVLAGCGARETFETIADEMVFRQDTAREIRVALPEETVLPVMQTETGRIYICRDFEVCVQTLPGGDLEATVRSLCGFSPADVDLVETAADGFTRYDFVWSSAGETGDQVGRACVVSDGVWHYCVSAMAPAGKAQQYRQIWDGMFETVSLG